MGETLHLEGFFDLLDALEIRPAVLAAMISNANLGFLQPDRLHAGLNFCRMIA